MQTQQVKSSPLENLGTITYHVQFRDDCGSKFAVINIKQPLCITLINLMEIS
jgi:hypothetical protein